jgi:hypothetical protein
VCFSFMSGSSSDTSDSLITGYQVSEKPSSTTFEFNQQMIDYILDVSGLQPSSVVFTRFERN